MDVISCVGGKGGTGKSSIALLLGWEFSRNHKKRVAILDSDRQGTCLTAKKLNDKLPFDVFSVASKEELFSIGSKLEKQNYDLLIIDGNPRSIHEDPALIEMISELSDLSLIISRPSPRDVNAQLKYIETARKNTKGQVRLLWNFYQKNVGSHRYGAPNMEELLGVKSIKTKIGLRVAFQELGYREGYIGELNNPEATVESKSLAKEIKEILNGKV